MLLLVSGEGPTDVGSNIQGENGWVFQPGPMALIIDKLAEYRLDYSLIGVCAMEFVSKKELSKLKKEEKPRSMTLPGKARPRETGFFFVNARTLAEQAARRARSHGT